MWLKPHGSHSSWSVISLCWLSFGLHGVGHAVWFFPLLPNCRRHMKGSWNATRSIPMKAQILRPSMVSGASRPSWSLRMARRKMPWLELFQKVRWLHALKNWYRWVSRFNLFWYSNCFTGYIKWVNSLSFGQCLYDFIYIVMEATVAVISMKQ